MTGLKASWLDVICVNFLRTSFKIRITSNTPFSYKWKRNPEINSDIDPDEEEEEQEDPDELGKALIKAAATGDSESILDLIKRKADPNYLDKKSWTPLIWAAS